MADAQPVIFVGGLERSGTALLERLLGELPEVTPLGQVVRLWTRGVHADGPCGCGQAFSECSFWGRVGARAFGRWRESHADRLLRLRYRVDRTRRIPILFLGLISREAELADYVLAYSRIYTAAAEVTGARAVIDASRRASLAYCLAATMDLRVVHVVRDPRAVAASWRRKARSGGLAARWAPVKAAIHWLTENLAFEILRAKGVQVVSVRYEDLLHRPRETLTDLIGNLELPPHPLTFLDGREARLGVAHTVSGTPRRLAPGRIRFRERGAELPRAHRWLITALTWPLLLRYGYHLIRWHGGTGKAKGRRDGTAARTAQGHTPGTVRGPARAPERTVAGSARENLEPEPVQGGAEMRAASERSAAAWGKAAWERAGVEAVREGPGTATAPERAGAGMVRENAAAGPGLEDRGIGMARESAAVAAAQEDSGMGTARETAAVGTAGDRQ